MLRIPARYAGPPGSANGGIACGLFAAGVDAPVAEVTLRQPVPLDTDLRLNDGAVYDGETLVATVTDGAVHAEPKAALTMQQAEDAAGRYDGRNSHPFPGCFVCGIDREPPDALGLRPGPVDGAVAAVWHPLAADRFLIWAALDCPGGWASLQPGRPMVLGRMSLEVHRPPVVGQPHVVQGWTLRTEGRKTFSATALYDADGEVLAVAQQTWFTVAVEQMGRAAGS